ADYREIPAFFVAVPGSSGLFAPHRLRQRRQSVALPRRHATKRDGGTADGGRGEEKNHPATSYGERAAGSAGRSARLGVGALRQGPAGHIYFFQPPGAG